jgi:predicted amidohydrolase
LSEDAREFYIQMVAAAWSRLKAEIEAKDPTAEDPGRLAAELLIAKIKEVRPQIPRRPNALVTLMAELSHLKSDE